MCRLTVVVAVWLACADGASAHDVTDLAPHSLWHAWSTQAWPWALWLLPGLLVLRGYVRLWPAAGVGARQRHGQAGCFVAGWFALGATLLSPLDAAGNVLFWAHMTQHEIMMLVAAPLLVLARPLGALTWGLPSAWRPGAAALARRLGLQAAMRWSTRPLVAWLLHAAVLWTWHLPPLFEAAVLHQAVHDVQHLSFLISALIFWWALLATQDRARHGTAVMSLFTTAVHTSILGALLTFSSRVWYPVYTHTASAWGYTALEDQQLGGLIMWVPGGFVFMIAGLALTAQWLEGLSGSRVVGTSRHPG